MSNKSNQILRYLEEIETMFRSTNRFRSGVLLSNENQKLVVDTLTLYSASWFDLISFNGHSTKSLHPRWTRFIGSLDLTVLIGMCKEADSLLLTMSCNSYVNFKHSLTRTFPLAGQFLAPLKGIFEAWFSNENHKAFSALHNCFVFMSRLNLPGLDDLRESALCDYLEREETLRTFPYQDESSSLESQILTKWFPRESMPDLYRKWNPKHGPGQIAEQKPSLAEKYNALGIDQWLIFINNKLPQEQLVLPRPSVSFERMARVVFVPKSIDKLRTICMEPTTLMWYQQGFGSNIVSYMRKHKYLRKRINLEHQEYNRDLAQIGSEDGSLATIDLSAASDSVAYSMVKDLFYKTSLIEILLATRSKNAILPDGSIIKNWKFAPMGSNLCFPIESLLFASIVEASILRSGDPVHSSLYRVYGDDIVVETKYVDTVVTRLEELGFSVNTKKSFASTTGPFFRESCGGEFLNGIDVTPVRIGRRFSGLHFDLSHPSRILGAIDLCNASYRILPSVRRWIIWKLNKLPRDYRVRYDDSGETGIFSVNPTNHHLGPAVYHTDYQEWYCRCGTPREKFLGSREDTDEDIRLYECLRVIDGREALVYPEDLVTTEIRRTTGSFWARIRDYK